MSDQCPAVDQLFDWISTGESKRPKNLTEHIYGCSTCSRVVMAEVRIRRERRRLQGLSGVAAAAILSLSLWQSDFVFSSSAPQELASQERFLYPTDQPQPVDAEGNLYWPDYPSSPGDPTPYPEQEEQFNRRSPRVVAWIKKKYKLGSNFRFYEEGQKFRSLEIPPGVTEVWSMSDAEFLEFSAKRTSTIPGLMAQAIARAEAERADFMLPLILKWYNEDRYHEITGWHSTYHDDAARFIRLFSPEEVFHAIDNYPVDDWRQHAHDIYQSNFLQ